MNSPNLPDFDPPHSDSPFIDMHTHQRLPLMENRETAQVISIYNLEPEEYGEKATESLRLSAGIHPYRLLEKKAIEEELQVIERLCAENRIQFIGECGLDSLKGPDLRSQEETFCAHIHLAEQYHKPLIIHCVRAFDALIRIKKRQGIQVPAIIHGYHKSPEMARQLYDHGFILSFGKGMMRPESPTAKALVETWKAELPFFLETDGSGMDIRNVYEAASNLLKTSTDPLKDAIFATWKKYT